MAGSGRVTAQASSFHRQIAMLGIAGHSRILVTRRGKQGHPEYHKPCGNQEHQIGSADGHPYSSSRTNSAMCWTLTFPRIPFLSWIMQAGQLVATTSAPLSSMARRFRSKIRCDVS